MGGCFTRGKRPKGRAEEGEQAGFAVLSHLQAGMASRTAVVFSLFFVFATALPILHVGPSFESGEPEFTGWMFSRTYVPEVESITGSPLRSAIDIGRDSSNIAEEQLVRDYSAAEMGNREEQNMSRTSERAERMVIALVWVAVAVFGLGAYVALHVARSRVLDSKEMLEMLSRVEKGDSTSHTDFEDESHGHPSSPTEEDLVGGSTGNDDTVLVTQAGTTSDDGVDLIILSGGEGEASEDLICFEDDGESEEEEESPDEVPDPELLPLPMDMAMESPSGELPPTGLELEVLALPDSPNPWNHTVDSDSLKSGGLLPVLTDAPGFPVLETPFATPLSSPVSSPTRELARLDNEPEVKPRQWTAVDLGLMMQLRPGLGPGAEGLWMVRLMMGVFGWISMLMIR